MATLDGKKIKDTYKSLLKVDDNGTLDENLQQITDGEGNTSGLRLNNLGDAKIDGTLEVGSIKYTNETVNITKFVDQSDGIANNDNDNTLPTSAAVKDYVDNNITAQDLDITGDTGIGAVDLDSESLSIVGIGGIETTVSGQTVTIDPSGIDSRLTENENLIDLQITDLTDLTQRVGVNETDISNEINDRISGDSSLQSAINSEASTRSAADITLQSNINSEETARILGDYDLQQQIDGISENDTLDTVTTRGNTTANDIIVGSVSVNSGTATQFLKADGSTDNTQYSTALELAAEASIRVTNDETLQDNIDELALDSINADILLQNNIDAEALTRSDADIALQDNIDAEATARGLADTTLQSNINSEETARIVADDALQGQIDGIGGDLSNYQLRSEKGQADGYASLDSNGTVPVSQLPESVTGALEFQGLWDASTNTPTLPDATTVKGHYYKVSVEGTYLGTLYHIGDWALSDGVSWEHIHTEETVGDVFGREGSIIAIESDYSAFYPLIQDLTDETQAREDVEADLSQEVTDRIAGDAALQGQIDDIQPIIDSLNLQSVTDAGNTTTNAIEADSFVKTGGTATEFLKADGSIDSTQYIPVGGAPAPNDATITLTTGDGLAGGGDFTTDQATNETLNITHADTTRTNTTSSSALSHEGTFTAITSVNTNSLGHVTGANTETYTLPSAPAVFNDKVTLLAGPGLTGGGYFTTNQAFEDTIRIEHATSSLNISGGNVALNYGDTFKVKSISDNYGVDEYGHVRNIEETNFTIPALPTLSDLGYTGATNANYITNNNQLINGAGYTSVTNNNQLTNGAGYTTNVGDITGVTAGTNLTGGGTSGTVTLNLAETPTVTDLNLTGGTFNTPSGSFNWKNTYNGANTNMAVLNTDGLYVGGAKLGSYTQLLSARVDGGLTVTGELQVYGLIGSASLYTSYIEVGNGGQGDQLKVLGDANILYKLTAQAIDVQNGLTAQSANISGGLQAGSLIVNDNNIYFDNGSGSGNVFFEAYGSASTVAYQFSQNNTTLARITDVGDFITRGDVIAYGISDKRLKDNIKPIENALDKIESIGGYTFDWNDKQSTYEGSDIGVIAQEIEAIAPELVTDRETGYKAVKYDKLVALLIESVKELSAKVKTLESKLQ